MAANRQWTIETGVFVVKIENRLALITGSKRIGSLVALALAEQGADVVLTYNRSKEEAEATATEIRKRGRRSLALRADVSRVEEVDALIDRLSHELGNVDILVNMASVYVSRSFDETTEEDWDANIDVNLKSVFLCSKAVVPGMKVQGAGRIISFADWVAASGRPRYKGYLSYYVSKVAVIGLTEALALELAPYNILVNAIAPGPILAPPDLTEEENKEVLKATPLGRWGGGMEIAKTVTSLIETDFITGECVRVDGGRHIN